MADRRATGIDSSVAGSETSSGPGVTGPDTQSGFLGTTQAHGQAVKLSAQDRAALNARAGKGLMGTVMAQGALALLASIVAWAVAGPAAGLSALAGAGAYLIPNTLFALRLLLAVFRPGGASPYTFLLGEILKIGMAVALLWLTVHVGGDRLVWPAMLVGLFCVLKGYVLLLMFRRL